MVEFTNSISAEDLKYLAENMRDIERRECLAMGFLFPLETLTCCATYSDVCYVFKYNDRPVCIAGLSREEPSGGRYLWMSSTDEITRFKREFVRLAAVVIEKWLDLYGEFYCLITTENKATIRWLKSLGGTASEPFYRGGEEFIKVSLKKYAWQK